VTLDLEHRRKGLLWYPTYTVSFKATYRFTNPDADPRTLRVRFPLPADNALFDDFVFALNGKPMDPASDVSKEMSAQATADAGAPVTVDVQYRSRGMRTWTYAFAENGAAQVRDFRMQMRTNFGDVDFPPGTVSPTTLTPGNFGAELGWSFVNLISGQAIGMELPERLNPGPFAARVTFFAPVSLLFFLTVMVIVGATSGPSLHPMHYWFISTAFFAFHLLLASRRPRQRARRLRGDGGRQPHARLELRPRDCGRPRRAGHGRRGAGGVSRALQLRVLLRGIYRPRDHDRRGRHAVRADADDGARVVGRGVQRQPDGGDERKPCQPRLRRSAGPRSTT
jgi:hypothetical protein